MIRDLRDGIADMKRDIERWEEYVNAAEAAGQAEFADQLRRWIAEVRKIIKDSGLYS
jgi:phage shock protein A